MNYTFQFGDVFAAWPLLVKGTLSTIELSMLAMLIGLLVAILCAWGKTAGPRPLRLAPAEAVLEGQHPDAARFARVAEAAAAACEPSDDIHASPEYRRALVATLTERALLLAAGDAA